MGIAHCNQVQSAASCLLFQLFADRGYFLFAQRSQPLPIALHTTCVACECGPSLVAFERHSGPHSPLVAPPVEPRVQTHLGSLLTRRPFADAHSCLDKNRAQFQSATRPHPPLEPPFAARFSRYESRASSRVHSFVGFGPDSPIFKAHLSKDRTTSGPKSRANMTSRMQAAISSARQYERVQWMPRRRWSEGERGSIANDDSRRASSTILRC